MTVAPLSLAVCAAPLAERAAEVAAALIENGWDVTVVATPAAQSWLDHDAVHSVTGRPAEYDYRRPEQPRRGPRPAAVVACPLTFNTLNKLAGGISDTYALGVLNEAVASRVPVIAVPVISVRLWSHPALTSSLERLTAAGVGFLDPQTGRPGASAVQSGTGPQVAAAFDPKWLLPHLTQARTA